MIKITELWHNKTESWLQRSSMMPKEDQLVIKSMHSLVSIGTERLLTTQMVNDHISKNMSVPFMKGDFNHEFTYGYSIVGQVISGPSSHLGKRVHLMHPHQDVIGVDKEVVQIIPDEVDLKTATLASNMETAVNAIWDSQISLGDKVLIIGYGIIGALIGKICQSITSVPVEVIETNSKKKSLIANSGLHLYEDSSEGEYDIVFNTSANSGMLQQALRLTRIEGKVIEVSWYGNNKVTLDLGTDFHYGRKQIISSQVSTIPGIKQPNWDYKKRKNLVFKILSNPYYASLINQEVQFENAPDFYQNLRNQPIDSIGIIIKY